MRRRLISAGLAIGALAMLGALVAASRPVPVAAHLAHRQALSELERASEDFATLRASLESAQATGQTLGEGMQALLGRFERGPEQLKTQLFQVPGRPAEAERLRSRFESYAGTVNDAAALMHSLTSEQDALVRSLDRLQRTGPSAVAQMREIRLDEAARLTFELVAATLDHARAGATTSDREIRALIAALRDDRSAAANMPAEIGALTDASESVLAGKARVAGLARRLAEVPLAASIENIRAAAEGLYRNTLDAVSRARTLLAVYAVLLLGAAAVIGFRLSQSYQFLNHLNLELEELNSSLEKRVGERTAALETALEELKESQVQLVQAEKMSSLGQLVAGISHEINTPLLYLANNAELIRERLDLLGEFVRHCDAAFALRGESFPDRPTYQEALARALKQLQATLRQGELIPAIEEAEELLADSSAGLDDLTAMAQGLKDFSRLDRAPIESFDVNAGLERSLLIARGALKHKANVRTFFGSIPEIRCAPSQLNQVFLNLLTNAAQAIEANGEVVVRTALHGEEHIAVTISDTGCGISPENLAKVRDPFFTTKAVGTGTGLGLSIVDQIVKAHGGELRIESELGKGSAFTIILPIAGGGAAADRSAAEDGPETRDASGGGEPAAELAEAG